MLLASLCLGLAAVELRCWLAARSATNHPDEPITVTLVMRNLADRRFSANWAGYDTWWSRPTYQFSPYTLLQTTIASLATSAPGENTEERQLWLARTASAWWGGLLGTLVFVSALTLGLPISSALLGQLVAALCLLNVQDSIYARCDSFVASCAAMTLLLGLMALRRPAHHRRWLIACALAAGVTLAAKINATSVLGVLVGVLLGRALGQRQSIAGDLAVLVLALLLGFVIATPNLLRDPQPELQGVTYEFSHYAQGHPPHKAYGFWDNNVFYWTAYLGWIGVGWGSLGLLGIGLSSIRRTNHRELLLLLAFACGLVPLLWAKARFERNWETVLAALCLLVALGASRVVARLRRHPLARPAALPFVAALALAQPGLTLYRFALAVQQEHQPTGPARQAWHGPPQCEFKAIFFPPRRITCDRVMLVDFGDPFSQQGMTRWMSVLESNGMQEFRSYWSQFGYPFSTIDVYHGPSRILVAEVRTEPRAGNAD